MVDRVSDKQIETLVSEWVSKNQNQYEDHFFIIVDSVHSDKVTFVIDDLTVKLHLSDGVACELNAKSSQEHIHDWLTMCNEKLLMYELPELDRALSYIFEKFHNMKKKILEKTSAKKADRMKDEYGDEVQEKSDADMSDNDNAWGEDMDQDDNDDFDYTQIVQQQANDEQLELQKKFGKIGGGSNQLSEIINLKSVRLFEKTKFYLNVLDAHDYISHNNDVIKGWLNLPIIKEFLTVRLEIDLNYVDIAPVNIEMFGWNIEEPLIISFSVKESKLLNVDETQMDDLDFKNMWAQGFLEFSCSNAGKEESYGCKDYLRNLFKSYIETHIHSYQHEKIHKSEEKKGQSKPKSGTAVGGLGFVSKLFSGTNVDDEKIARLVDMGFDIDVARNALKRSKNDIHLALDQLKDEFLEGKLIQDEGITITSSKLLPRTNNDLVKLGLYISDQLEMVTRTCFICLSPLTGDSAKVRTCHNDYCEYTFEESFGVKIYPMLKFFLNEAFLDLTIASKALFSTRATTVVEPFPTFFLKHFELRGKRGYLDEIQKVKLKGEDIKNAKCIDEKNKDLAEMQNIFAKIPSPNEMLKNSHDEESLKEYLLQIFGGVHDSAHKAYKLISYILATNRSSMRELKEEDQVVLPTPGAFQQFLLTPQDHEKEKIFNQRKAKQGSYYLWHGSSLENWFSILRNGLRNLSNSHMMTAGAAYGQGIYASANYNTSLGYSSRYSQSNKSWAKAGFQNQYIIGIVEVIDKPEYKKDPACNVCVITDEQDMILRYLFQYQGYGGQGDLNTLKLDFDKPYKDFVKKMNREKTEERKLIIEKAYSQYLQRKTREMEQKARIESEMLKREDQEAEKMHDNKLEKMKDKIQGKGSEMATNRIMSEYKILMKSSDFKNIMTIDMKNDNLYNWTVIFDLSKYETSPDLKKDFAEWSKTFNTKEQIEYEVIFSDSFPFTPPFIRVVKPRFMYRTGHITVGGSICMESLTPKGWSSARSMESQFIEILSLLNVGEARLDTRLNQPYTLYEAKEAFTRVAKEHGWLN